MMYHALKPKEHSNINDPKKDLDGDSFVMIAESSGMMDRACHTFPNLELKNEVGIFGCFFIYINGFWG